MSDESGVGDEMKWALRELNCPVEVALRSRDFNMVTVKDPESGQGAQMPCDGLVTFKSDSHREIHDTGIFEFRTMKAVDGRPPVTVLIFVHARDILYMRAMSQVAL